MKAIHRFINTYRVEEEEVDPQRILVSPLPITTASSSSSSLTTTASSNTSSSLSMNAQAIMDGKLKGLASFLKNQLNGTSNQVQATSLFELILLKKGSNLIEISDEEKKKLLYKVEAYCLK